MAVSNIIQNASQINWGHSMSLTRIKSDSGASKAQRRGPHLWNVEVTLNPMHDDSDAYHGIQGEIRVSEYGVKAIKTQMPSTEVYNRGTWAGSPKVRGASQSGTSINLDGFTANVTNVVLDGDWLTFPDDTKVYRVVGNHSSSSLGQVTITLDTPTVKTPSDNAVLVVGNSVEFNFVIVNPDDVDPSKTPAGSRSIAQFGKFMFEEVL